MPTYEYECTECGKVFDLVQPMSEPPRRRLRKTDPRPCKCDATVARRIGTGGGIIFKGSGFYTTDYRSEGYKKAAKADANPQAGSDGASGSKPAKDASTKPEKNAAKKDPKSDT